MIVLYSTEHCPMCNMLKQKLNAAKLEYEICTDVDQMLQLGIHSVPKMLADGKLLNLSEAVKYINQIKRGDQ